MTLRQLTLGTMPTPCWMGGGSHLLRRQWVISARTPYELIGDRAIDDEEYPTVGAELRTDDPCTSSLAELLLALRCRIDSASRCSRGVCVSDKLGHMRAGGENEARSAEA